MGQVDKAVQIRTIFNFRKSLLKHKKYIKILVVSLVLVLVVAAIIYEHARDTVSEYALKHQDLDEKLIQFEVQKEQIEYENEKILSDAELIAKNNQHLIEENIKLQNSLKMAASVGIKPQNYGEAEEIDTSVDYSKLKYLGEFEGTAYTPSVEECSNDLGYTASGKPIIPGVSIAVDTKYWKLGTKFYIEGLGYVVAMDTGNAVKGEKRFDYAVFDKEYALELGRRNWKVYLVIEE